MFLEQGADYRLSIGHMICPSFLPFVHNSQIWISRALQQPSNYATRSNLPIRFGTSSFNAILKWWNAGFYARFTTYLWTFIATKEGMTTTDECIHSPIQGFCSFFLTPKLRDCDETLPIINQPKHPKEKGKIQGTKWTNPRPRRQKNHLRGQTTKATSSSQTPFSSEKHIK